MGALVLPAWGIKEGILLGKKEVFLPKAVKRAGFGFLGTEVPNSRAWRTVALC